jgi:hypothetical protein
MCQIVYNAGPGKNAKKKQKSNAVDGKPFSALNRTTSTGQLSPATKANNLNPHLTKTTTTTKNLSLHHKVKAVPAAQRVQGVAINYCHRHYEPGGYDSAKSMLDRRVLHWRKGRQVWGLDIIRLEVGIGGCGGVINRSLFALTGPGCMLFWDLHGQYIGLNIMDCSLGNRNINRVDLWS